MSEAPKYNTERYLPLGYSVDELKAMDQGTFERVCDEQNLDVERMYEHLGRSEHFAASPDTSEDLIADPERPDMELLKAMNQHFKRRFRGEFNIKAIREDMLEKRDPNIPNDESHANSLLRYMQQEVAQGKNDPYNTVASGIAPFYHQAFREFGVKRYDALTAKGLTVYEAAQQLLADLQTEYESKTHNAYREEGFLRAQKEFQEAMEFDDEKHGLQKLLQNVINGTATPEETRTLNKILTVVKGSYFRAGESTISAGEYDRFVAELVKVYEENLPAKHMNPAAVTAAEVFDADTHPTPPELKEQLRSED